jgi:hypothetical protein
MLYRNKTTGVVKTQGEIRRDNANTSFPAVWDTTVCELLNIDPVFNAPQPTPTELQQVSQQGVVQDSKGNWIENWVLVDKFSTYTTEEGVTVTKEEQETAHLAKLDADKAQANKDKASKLLAETDWVVLPDVLTLTNKDEFIAYRAALRDIAVNPTASVEFPVRPETVWA